jgi:hypothetical protein
VDRSAPLFREIGGTDSDVLAIRNRRSAAWTDVNLAVYTVETTGTEGPPSKSAHNLTTSDMMALQRAIFVAANPTAAVSSCSHRRRSPASLRPYGPRHPYRVRHGQPRMPEGWVSFIRTEDEN